MNRQTNSTTNLKMREKISIWYLLLLLLLVDYISADVNSVCYYGSYNGKLAELYDKWERENCSATIETCDSVQNKTIGDEIPCDTSVSKSSYEPFDRTNGRFKEKFEIRIEREKDINFFHVIISEIQFRKLRIRLADIIRRNDKIFYWQTIEFPPGPKPQSISLFLSFWGKHNTVIQFYGEGSDYKFFRRYDTLPPVTGISEGNEAFGYVDTTLPGKVHLYVQPLPENLNVTTYYVEFKDDSKNCINQFNFTKGVMHKEVENIAKAGNYYFVVTAINADGKNISDPVVANFYVEMDNMGLIKMIVSVVAIPIALFFVAHRIFIYVRDKVFPRMRTPYCLLVYGGTHDSHIDAVLSLAEYLEGCKIHVMIDIWDIPKEDNRNPGYWCDTAFKRADVIVVVKSPPFDKSVVVTRSPYRCLDQYIYTIIHENRRRRDKKYVVVQFPYCEKYMVPIEVSSVPVLEIPKQLRELINEIHDMKYTELYGLPDTVKFVNSLKSTEQTILNGAHDHKPTCLNKLADIIFPRMDGMQIDQESESDEDTSNCIMKDLNTRKIKPSTDIRTLDL